MKKTLIYLQSLALTTTPILTVVACNKTNKTTKDKLNPPSVLSEQEKEIIKNTNLFTKLLLLSRHENLNFNSTDLLNSVFAPKTTWSAFSRNYTIGNKTYNLNDYTEKLTSEYSNLAKLNATEFDPFLASTLTGMYDDKLYQNYVNQKIIKRQDIFGFFNDKIAADNITPAIQLSNDFNRKQLAWANFTGPLSKYIADNHILDYQHLEYGKEDARHFYGRFLEAVVNPAVNTSKKLLAPKDLEGMKIEFAIDDKIKGGKIEDEFGKYQTKLFRNQMKSNFSSKILEFMPFIQNFNETATGSIYGLKLLNSLFPFTDTKADMDATYIIFFLLQTSIKWMRAFSNDYRKTGNKKAEEIWNKATKLTGSLDIPIAHSGLFKEAGINFFERIKENGSYDFKVQMLMKKGDKRIELFKTINEFKNLTSDWVKEWDEDIKAKFLKHFKNKVKEIQNAAAAIKEGISEFIQEGLNALISSDDVINLFTSLGDMIGVIAANEDAFISIDENNNYKNKDFDTLTKTQQQEIANQLGLNKKDNKFKEGSVLKELYKIANNEGFSKLFLNHDSPLYKYNSQNAAEIHENLLQYALNDKYWAIDNKSFKMNGAISGDKSLNSKFSYSIEYKGKGDKKVTKFLDKPVDLPNNFNPIEPWHTPSETSKEWTAQDHIDYTGLGNDIFYDDVNFKYNVEWSNVSKDPEFPYWVITKVDCFRNENGTWKQFYPVM